MSLVNATILDAIDNPSLFAPWFKKRETWSRWFIFLRALFGLPMGEAELALFRECTGRDTAPSSPSLEAWLIVGRRGGKSFVLAVIAVFIAVFRDWRPYLVPGERAVILVIATDRRQARVIFKYVRALMLEVPALKQMVVRESDETLELSTGLSIEIQTANFRSVRGQTVCGCLCDEIAFWRTDDASANPDTEILDAIRPAMATVPDAMLLCASSPYARRGQLYENFRRYFGQAGGPLVWKAPTLTMNPSLRKSVVDAAYERDPASASAEYGAEFRSDLEAFVSPEVIREATVERRRELPPATGVQYFAFVDPAGGSGGDSFTLAVAHRDRAGRAILDAARERKPLFSPAKVVEEYADLLLTYRCRSVRGDRWGGEYPREGFRKKGVAYEVFEHAKSDVYRDVLPLLNSGRVELLDLPRLGAQFVGLERRTSRNGKDSIDHAPGGHDDLANAVAGALLLATTSLGPMVISDELLVRSAQPALWRGPMKEYF